MTTLKTALATAAALCVAAPALAGDGYKKTKTTVATDGEVMMETTQTTVTTRTDVAGSVKTMHPSKVNDTVGEILQADGEPSIQSDQEIIVDRGQMTETEFRRIDDDGMIRDNAIVVPGSGDTLSTVTCPAGTEAQLDMTCLITGDWTPTTDG